MVPANGNAAPGAQAKIELVPPGGPTPCRCDGTDGRGAVQPIATPLDPRTMFSDARQNAPESGKRDRLIRKLDAAADYSVKPGNRVRESWIGRAERVEAGEIIATEASAEWLDVFDEKYVINRVRGPTTRYIHELGRVNGMGKRAVVKLLNADLERHPAWRGTTWQPSAVQRCWQNRAVFGEATLLDGSEIRARYYPPVLAGPSGPDGTYTDADYEEAERLFYLGAAARATRRHKGPLHKGDRFANILPPAECTCEAYDTRGNVKHGRLAYTDKSRNNRYLTCDHALRNVPLIDGTRCKNHRHYNHPALERVMLAILPSFDFSRMLAQPDPHTAEIAATEALIKSKTDRANWLRLNGEMSGDTLRAINQLDAEAGAARDKLAALHKLARIAEAQAQRDSWGEFITLLGTMRALPDNDPECVKLRGAIAQELRRIIDVIRVEGDDLVAWLSTGWMPVRIGIRLSGRTFMHPTMIVQKPDGSRREEFPTSFGQRGTDSPPDPSGCLEPYVNGVFAAQMNTALMNWLTEHGIDPERAAMVIEQDHQSSGGG